MLENHIKDPCSIWFEFLDRGESERFEEFYDRFIITFFIHAQFFTIFTAIKSCGIPLFHDILDRKKKLKLCFERSSSREINLNLFPVNNSHEAKPTEIIVSSASP